MKGKRVTGRHHLPRPPRAMPKMVHLAAAPPPLVAVHQVLVPRRPVLRVHQAAAAAVDLGVKAAVLLLPHRAVKADHRRRKTKSLKMVHRGINPSKYIFLHRWLCLLLLYSFV